MRTKRNLKVLVYQLTELHPTRYSRDIRDRFELATYIRQVILKRYLLSRIALRPLKIVEPYLVEQERMANAQLLRYGSKHLEQNS